jgi:hypothetical protein
MDWYLAFGGLRRGDDGQSEGVLYEGRLAHVGGTDDCDVELGECFRAGELLRRAQRVLVSGLCSRGSVVSMTLVGHDIPLGSETARSA